MVAQSSNTYLTTLAGYNTDNNKEKLSKLLILHGRWYRNYTKRLLGTEYGTLYSIFLFNIIYVLFV